MRHLAPTRRPNPSAGLGVGRAAALLMGVALLFATACASGQSGTAAGVDAPNVIAGNTALEAGSAKAIPSPAQAGPATVIKACSLLTPAEIKTVIGTNSGAIGQSNVCEWTNKDNEHSVTVEIGDTGTAVDGQLPDPMPGSRTENGPDGIRFSSANVAEFLVGDRACQVQVVTSVTDDSDRPTQVKLIGLIRSRLTT